MKPYLLLTGLILLAMLGWGYFLLTEEPAPGDEKKNVDIVCVFYYQAPVDQANLEARTDEVRANEFDERKIEVSVPVASGPQPEIGLLVEPKTIEFETFKVSVIYQINSLVVNVFDRKEKAVMTQLYQFGPKLRNQFDGKHGFSGLVYVYHPENNSELQFVCMVK